MPTPALAIVMPTLDEGELIEAAIRAARSHTAEIVVSDGGSRDGTVEIARRLGATVVEGPAGRGSQLNRGAAATRAEVLLFLHVDTRLPAGAGEAIREALDGGANGGGFLVRWSSPRRVYRLAERIVNLRTRLSGAPLGDQAQFYTRQAFETLGGFREWPILEDLDLARRLKRLGPIAILAPPVETSARRFERQGLARTVAVNWLIVTLYLMGVSPRRLARLYPASPRAR